MQNNNFSQGINKDINPLKQPENSYRDALNIVKLSDVGDFYSISNEKGTNVYCNQLPTNYKIIGRCVLERFIIVFLHNEISNSSQIGYIDTEGNYIVKLDDLNNELGLDLDHPIDCTARVLINDTIVVYYVDNKNPIRFLDFDNIPAPGKIDKASSLVSEANFPSIDNFTIVNSTSTIKCGAYQFLFRYLDEKGNVTLASTPSQLVSIGQFIYSEASGSYTGGDSTTLANKIIRLTLSNIDTDYDRLEIIAVRFEGLDNQLKAEITGRIGVGGSSTLTFDYKGDVLEELIIEEIIGATTNYATAKCIEQKDGRLFVSNLKEDTVQESLQNIANNITIKYAIEQFDYSTKNYKSTDLNAFKVGYKRGEVYAFAFGVVYKNGAKSTAYHIPAPDVGDNNPGIKSYANTGTKVLGTYKSELTYPTGFSTGYDGEKIRYHVMPSYNDEPPFSSISNDNATLNILGINIEFGVDLPTSVKDKIQGIYIIRRSKDDVNSRLIFSQGIANNLMDYYEPNNDEEEVALRDITFNGISGKYYNLISPGDKKKLIKAPFLGGFRLNSYLPIRFNGSLTDNDVGEDTKFYFNAKLNGGLYLQTTNLPYQYTFINGPGYTRSSARNGTPNTFTLDKGYLTGAIGNGTLVAEMYKDLLAYYSPDMYLFPRKLEGLSKIRNIAQIKFELGETVFNKSTYLGNTTTSPGSASSMLRITQHWNYYRTTQITPVISPSNVDINNGAYVDRNSELSTTFNLNIYNLKQDSFLYLYTPNNTLVDNEYNIQQLNISNDANDPSTGDNLTIEFNDLDIAATAASIGTKNLYEIYNDNNSLFGSLESQEYLICKSIVYTGQNLTTVNLGNVFGGDTYLSRFSFTNKVFLKSKHLKWRDSGFGTDKWRYAEQDTTNSPVTDSQRYLDIRSLISIFVESYKNVELRYTEEGGPKFYPKNTFNETVSTNPEIVEDPTDYNIQYDYENNLQPFFTAGSFIDLTSGLTQYKTRTIWSDQTITGGLRDKYRDIAVNNYYDLPFNTGEIWDSFVYNNIFYLHTPKTLYRTYVNSVESQASTAGQVVLGTGGVFPVNLPPQQVLTQNGGYGGSISQWGGAVTPFGYIFPDSLQGKLFNLSGEGLSEISLGTLTRYMNDNLSVLTKNSYPITDPNDFKYNKYYDNPFHPTPNISLGRGGILSEYDFELKRWIICKNSEFNDFTLSYDMLSKNFISFHSYKPNMLISRDNDLYAISNTQTTVALYQHNRGNYGNYYDLIVAPSEIEFVINAGGPINKVFDNLVLSMDLFNTTIPMFYRNTGDTLIAYNELKSTGITQLEWNNNFQHSYNRGAVRIQKINDAYRVNIPQNASVQDNVSNINQQQLFRDRMKGQWLGVRLSFTNSDNLKLVIHNILSKFRVVSR
jgi:hypothetical protein